MTDLTKERNADLRKVNNMVKIGLLSALAGLLMLVFKFPLPFAPPFMTVDFGDVPSLIAGFALGPVAGIITVIIKNIINLIFNGTLTAFVGEFSNVIVGSAFVGISALIYKKHRSRKAALKGLVIGLLAMTLIATLSNYFVVFPLYAKAFGIPIQALVDMTTKVNSSVSTFEGVMLFAVIPFNLAKGALNALVTIFIYKYISNIFKKI